MLVVSSTKRLGKARTAGDRRFRRHLRVRRRVSGTGDKPRLAVFRSSKHVYVQVIDDVRGHTLASASDLDPLREGERGQNKTAVAASVGALIARRAQAVGVTKVVFDRGGYRYHGRVKALADAARGGGLLF